MNLVQLYTPVHQVLERVRSIDGIAPLLLRLYLAPIFIKAGGNKLAHFEDIVAWFGNPEWGLGLPFPEVMAALAAGTEFFGGWLLLFGFATRLIVIPMMFTMIVAAATAHWQFGWHALPETQLTVPWEWRMDLIEGANERKEVAKNILREHGNYSWLTEAGSITVLKNGIEFAATYFIMLFSLFFTGGGKYTSVDYYVGKRFMPAQ